MSDMQNERPGEPGTTEGESGASEEDPVVPGVEGRDVDPEGGEQAS